ncbi:MAG: SAM-dependent chlorinase/fluorinase [Planctomycetes bacterium]|nr:SAM-dependent chlorinase/fluorinase [Planctomycetota bacterium]MCB9885073.1 SAM-dependent chlorinase/fluorinase [Planctomycetota bacterium]
MQIRPSGHVVLLTDFGHRDPYVGILRGAVLRANPRATIVDLGHEVPAQDVEAGAFWLWSAVDRFVPGSVFVAVVDPGVGTPRRLLAAQAHGCYWVAPDNGLLTHVLAGDDSADVRLLDPEHLQLVPASRTFHGRDVLAPVGGWLSGGRYGFSALGERLPDPVRLPEMTAGSHRVVHVDAFGNLITNLPAATAGNFAAIAVAGRQVAVHGTYGEVPDGEMLALVGSFGFWEIARNGGSAAKLLGVGRGAPITLVQA